MKHFLTPFSLKKTNDLSRRGLEMNCRSYSHNRNQASNEYINILKLKLERESASKDSKFELIQIFTFALRYQVRFYCIARVSISVSSLLRLSTSAEICSGDSVICSRFWKLLSNSVSSFLFVSSEVFSTYNSSKSSTQKCIFTITIVLQISTVKPR